MSKIRSDAPSLRESPNIEAIPFIGSRVIVGKRRAGGGWDVVLIRDREFDCYGPFRLRREAIAAMSLGTLGLPHTQHRPDLRKDGSSQQTSAEHTA